MHAESSLRCPPHFRVFPGEDGLDVVFDRDGGECVERVESSQSRWVKGFGVAHGAVHVDVRVEPDDAEIESVAVCDASRGFHLFVGVHRAVRASDALFGAESRDEAE